MKRVSELYSPKSVAEYTLDDDRLVEVEDEWLRLSADREAVEFGRTITVTIENVSEREVIVSPEHPFTLLEETKSGWVELVGTTANGVPLAALALSPGSSEAIELPIRRDAVADFGTYGLLRELSPGQHRFVYLGSNPYLCIDFEIKPSEKQ
ncbi:hypothetical protein [Haladaptatus cibarius]|uniref:hypothetical protein n=1 Tax=Haladaptatus cibarius TaxID=453847 RepID=UPI0006786D3C|nr:hypothetical protein [Haladaptatus cibarius]